jgi:non-specific serine/threonine protein kinase
MCSGGDLFDYVMRTKPSELERKVIFRTILSALDYMHTNGFYHCDLKMENIFIDANDQLKVGDFGFTTKNPNLWKSVGTKAYRSPEALNSFPFSAESFDIWSLGMLLLLMTL